MEQAVKQALSHSDRLPPRDRLYVEELDYARRRKTYGQAIDVLPRRSSSTRTTSRRDTSSGCSIRTWELLRGAPELRSASWRRLRVRRRVQLAGRDLHALGRERGRAADASRCGLDSIRTAGRPTSILGWHPASWGDTARGDRNAGAGRRASAWLTVRRPRPVACRHCRAATGPRNRRDPQHGQDRSTVLAVARPVTPAMSASPAGSALTRSPTSAGGGGFPRWRAPRRNQPQPRGRVLLLLTGRARASPRRRRPSRRPRTTGRHGKGSSGPRSPSSVSADRRRPTAWRRSSAARCPAARKRSKSASTTACSAVSPSSAATQRRRSTSSPRPSRCSRLRGLAWHRHRLPDHVALWYELAAAHRTAGASPRRPSCWYRRITESGVEHLYHPIEYVRSHYFAGPAARGARRPGGRPRQLPEVPRLLGGRGDRPRPDRRRPQAPGGPALGAGARARALLFVLQPELEGVGLDPAGLGHRPAVPGQAVAQVGVGQPAVAVGAPVGCPRSS